MKKNRMLIMLFIIFLNAEGISNFLFAQKVNKPVRDILIASMDSSEKAWNEGDLERYMHNYWKSDSLRFISKSGITFGWQNILDRYKRGYPDKEMMGKLELEILSIDYIGENNIFMTGKWSIQRKKEKIEGYFSLIWTKINGKWSITADHSS